MINQATEVNVSSWEGMSAGQRANGAASDGQGFFACLAQLSEASLSLGRPALAGLVESVEDIGAFVSAEEDYELSRALLAAQMILPQATPSVVTAPPQEDATPQIGGLWQAGEVQSAAGVGEQTLPQLQAVCKATQGAVKAAAAELEFRADGTERQDDETPLQAEPGLRQATVFDTGGRVFVHVGDAVRSNQPPTVSEQVRHGIMQALKTGESTLVVELEPANLGKITIEVFSDDTGQMKILLTAKRSETQSLLEKHLLPMQAALNERSDVPQTELHIAQRLEDRPQNLFFENDGERQRQGQEHRRKEKQDTDDFFQRLRLGLTTLEEVS